MHQRCPIPGSSDAGFASPARSLNFVARSWKVSEREREIGGRGEIPWVGALPLMFEERGRLPPISVQLLVVVHVPLENFARRRHRLGCPHSLIETETSSVDAHSPVFSPLQNTSGNKLVPHRAAVPVCPTTFSGYYGRPDSLCG